MQDVVIVEAKRTAVGRMGGTIKDIPPEELIAFVMKDVIATTRLDPTQIDEVILGHSKQSADTPNIARLASLKAGLPEEVPAYTVHRQCGSGMQAVINAAQQIRLGESEIILAGGVESMSTAPYYVRNARYGIGAGNGLLLDPNTESQPRSQPSEIYGELTMGMTAENLAEQFHISREEQDRFALNSQIKALQAIQSGRFKNEIVPILVKVKKEEYVLFDTDEHPRKTSMEELAKLKPVFKAGGTVTAGNSSGRNDGASCLLLMSLEKAKKLGIKPMAKIVSYASAGVPPQIMGIGPVPATEKALKKAGLTLEEIDLVELNEAFAAQALAVMKVLNLEEEKTNVNGGAIALGHPIGNSGARIMVTLLHEMEKREAKRGLATLCIAGGMGITTILERFK
jgi:acetyl-CoA C-acetyltransferase